MGGHGSHSGDVFQLAADGDSVPRMWQRMLAATKLSDQALHMRWFVFCQKRTITIEVEGRDWMILQLRDR